MSSKDKNISAAKPTYELIPEKLRHFRLMENYTQKYVASKLGISRQSYNHYESGRVNPDISILISLSELYKIPVECLFEMAPKPDDSLLGKIERMAAYSKEFIDFFNIKDNIIKYHSLSRKEKQLIFYFKHLKEDIQKDFLIVIYLKYIQSLSDNA